MSYNNENGKLIERLEDQNATMIYCYAFDLGLTDINPINLERGVIRMHSAITQLKTNDFPIGTPQTSQKDQVLVQLSELGTGGFAKLTELYIEKFLEKQNGGC